MSDDLHGGLDLPPDREPPARLRAATLERALRSSAPAGRARYVVPLLAAACVALLAVGGIAFDRFSGTAPSPPVATGAPTQGPTGMAPVTPSPTDDALAAISLDRGPLDGHRLSGAVRDCATEAGLSRRGLQVRYSRLVDGIDGSTPLLLVADRGGTLYRCGAGPASRLEPRTIDDPRDVEGLRGGRTATGTATVGGFTDLSSTQVFQLGDQVARVDSRLVGPDGPLSRWRSMPDVDGFAFAVQWFTDREVSLTGAGVRVQLRAIDTTGNAIVDNALQGYSITADGVTPR